MLDEASILRQSRSIAVVFTAPRDGAHEPLFQLDLRGEPQNVFGSVDRRNSPPRVLKPLPIVFPVRDTDDLGSGTGQSSNGNRQVMDRSFRIIPDIEDQAFSRFDLSGQERPIYGVIDVGEAAALQSVAVNRDRLALQGLADEVSHHAAVALFIQARAIGVEITDDSDGEPFGRIREGKMLVDG